MSAGSNALTKQDLEELLQPKLKAENAKIEDISVRYLTKPGDNYGSTMLAVDVYLTPGPKTLPLVAKMLPKSTDLQEIFQVEKTVRKEIDLYKLVRPAFESLQKENNVPEDKYLDVIPLCYGARISSTGDTGPVDDTSIILLENLKVQGYDIGDRFTGLNLEHCKLVVDKLARFHATAVALKIKKPEEFKTTVLHATTPLDRSKMDINFTKLFENIPEYETLKERINAALQKGFDVFTSSPVPPREPFATIAHFDLWTNNIMFQYESDSSRDNPTSLRFVDFQITEYASPAKDLLFFLYSSAHLDVLSHHYDYLVRFYYDNFVDCLRLLNCNISPFPFDLLVEEMKYVSTVEFFQLAFILPFINLAKEDAISTAEFTHEDFKKPQKLGKFYLDRARMIVLDFANRNWI